ncbi:hypothetical protein [Vibrio phage JSF12]|uniref:Uncharacterized protein n=2 Tax=Jesfedecavirus TaxID=2560156 RepID=A0A2D0YLU7_9CAUD|nr:HNH endonuclease [Vibrio phage JSF10]YP_009794818.1 HNH endonuclease [Vibrio phage JSF12]ASV43446.1 hypothetical protein [Vibrio phage JSF10]ASV43653.1 hypothetical protein [Vibrio phage JSF12]
MKLEEAILQAKEHYKTELPKTVSEYTKTYPKGLSRQVLKSRFGLTAGEFLTLLGAEYSQPNRAEDLLKQELELKNLTALESLADKTTKSRVSIRCNTCSNEFSTCYDSLRLSKYGCPQCAGNKPLYLRRDFVQGCADRVNAEVLYVPTNNSQKVLLRCCDCKGEYSITLSKLTNPQTDLEGTCPDCRSTDRRVLYKGITFGSGFELDCYKILEHFSPALHVKYKDHFTTNRRWVCDFVIGDYWVEVSNFKSNYKGYFENIDLKRSLVESNGKTFVFLTSLEEVRNFVNMI